MKSNLRGRGFIPSVIGNPFGQPDLSSDYRVFLTTHSNQTESLRLIVRWGIEAIDKKWQELEKLGITVDGITALTALDRLALTAGGPTQMLTNQILTVLDVLQTAIQKAHAQKALGGAPQQVAVSYENPGSQYIAIQLTQLSIVGWILWAAITLVVGSCALVWFNDGFGIGRDYLRCFLWGLGMPAIAQGFGGLNANSVASTLSLQIAR